MREDARHLIGDAAAESIGLHEIDGGEKTRLAEKIGPRVGNLSFQLVDLMIQRDVFECGGGFRE